jgi:hypothetical protein
MAKRKYVKQVWVDGDPQFAPSSARMQAIESGIINAQQIPAAKGAIGSPYVKTYVALNSWTTMNYDYECYDTDDMFAAGDYRIYCRTAGIYCARMHVYILSGGAVNSETYLRIMHSGGSQLVEKHFNEAGATLTISPLMSASTIYSMAVGEYIYGQVWVTRANWQIGVGPPIGNALINSLSLDLVSYL